nr:MAG TPA: hypothetical protein [Caudoviricetes sp.]
MTVEDTLRALPLETRDSIFAKSLEETTLSENISKDAVLKSYLDRDYDKVDELLDAAVVSRAWVLSKEAKRLCQEIVKINKEEDEKNGLLK